MFDIGFWELALIGVIALLVVGPERLPGVARNVGLWVGRVRRYVSHVKQDIERELHADEVRELLRKPEGLESIRDVARETASVLDDTRKELNAAAQAMSGETSEPAMSGEKPAPETPPEQAARRVAHHAVDEDPFAPASIARVAPDADPRVPPQDAPDAAPHAPAEPDANTSVADHEQQPERQGQH